jgi:hypothetical protein
MMNGYWFAGSLESLVQYGVVLLWLRVLRGHEHIGGMTV